MFLTYSINFVLVLRNLDAFFQSSHTDHYVSGLKKGKENVTMTGTKSLHHLKSNTSALVMNTAASLYL